MLPKIAILLDENTSEGGTRYELGKNYVEAIVRAGGQPVGLFFTPDQLIEAADFYDGVLRTGLDIKVASKRPFSIGVTVGGGISRA